MLQLLAILLPILIGFTFAVALVVRDGRWIEWGLCLFLAPAIGIAISSALYFLWILIFQPTFALPLYLGVEGVFLVGSAFFTFRRQSHPFPEFHARTWPKPRQWDLSTWVGVLAVVVLLVGLANFLEEWLLAFFASPAGNWDAFAIWNLHARFIASGDAWRVAFSPEMAWWTHPDYPLLLSAFIARVWVFSANQSPWVPAAIDLYFHFGLLGVLMLGVWQVQGWRSSVFAGLFTLPLLFFSLEFQQYADLPLAFFFLAGNLFLLLAEHFPEKQARYLALAGFMVGAALWTKNEGWAFLVAVVVVEALRLLSASNDRRGLWKRWLWLGLGCLPMLAVVLLFKSQVAVSNDVVGGLDLNLALQKLSDPARYAVIWQGLVQRFFAVGMNRFAILPILLVFTLVIGWTKTGKEQSPLYRVAGRIILVGCIYFVIFLLTPYPLEWHVETSISRLVSHLVPSLILFVFLFTRSLDRPKENIAAIIDP